MNSKHCKSTRRPRKPRATRLSSNAIVEADLISDGADQIRPGVWVSHCPKIYSDPACTKLKEFDEPRWLRKLLWDDIVAHVISSAARRGLCVLNICGSYFKLELPQRKAKWIIKPNYRLAQKIKTTRLFKKPYVDAGRDVDWVTLWWINPKNVIETMMLDKSMDLNRWHTTARENWHGRHNPPSGETSVASPRTYQGRYIPSKLLRGLYKKFGNSIDLMDFIPKSESDSLLLRQ